MEKQNKRMPRVGNTIDPIGLKTKNAGKSLCTGEVQVQKIPQEAGLVDRKGRDREGERLQKVIAQAGIASRRHAEELILAGRVSVNGQKVTALGTKVIPSDRVAIDGCGIDTKTSDFCYYLLNKPVGYITSASDPHGRKTVLDLMQGVKERIYPVGRLDNDTSGLLLLTNDGELAYRLMHPRYGVEKTYRVEVKGPIPGEVLEHLRRGVKLEDGLTAPAKVKAVEAKGQGNLQQVLITIHEGRNRQVRRMFAMVGYPVITLQRVRFGPLSLAPNLPEGRFRHLSAQEIEALYKAVKLQL